MVGSIPSRILFVLEYCKKLTSFNDFCVGRLRRKMNQRSKIKVQSSGSLRRKDRQQAETLEQMFYHLQTDPEYIVNLLEGTIDRSIL